LASVASPEGSVNPSRSTGPVALTTTSGSVLPSRAVTMTVSGTPRAGGVAWGRGRAGAGFGGCVAGGVVAGGV